MSSNWKHKKESILQIKISALSYPVIGPTGLQVPE